MYVWKLKYVLEHGMIAMNSDDFQILCSISVLQSTKSFSYKKGSMDENSNFSLYVGGVMVR